MNIFAEITGKKRDGFFIEIGGHDGEEYSNTLFFEIERNYTGKPNWYNAVPFLYRDD